MKKTTPLIVINNQAAKFLPKPFRFLQKRGRRTKDQYSSFEMLNANHEAIRKFRQRGFSWTDIQKCLENSGIVVSLPMITQWKNRNMKCRKNTTTKAVGV